jgi:hypothetical protein
MTRSKLILAVPLMLLLGACVGPPVLQKQVLSYDEVAKEVDEKLLLLNIARIYNYESVHFTTTSSIAATFDWSTTIGVGGQFNGSDAINLNLGATAADKPTFSIIPVSGKEFTKRVVTPFYDGSFEFLVFQGGAIAHVMSLMASGIEVQRADGSFVRFIENDPRRPDEYAEFRRIASQLQRLNDARKLFVRSLVFEETLVEDFKGMPRAEDINNGFNMGLRWRQKPGGNYELTRLDAGRVVVLNYDPMAMTDRERFELNERIRKNPPGFVFLDIRSDGPGGNLPLRGAIKLRSMIQILAFLAVGIESTENRAAAPDPHAHVTDAATPLKINVTDNPPATDLPSVRYKGRYYAVNDTPWDRKSFLFLNILFQTAVGDVENVGIPITIAK